MGVIMFNGFFCQQQYVELFLQIINCLDS